MKLFNDFRKSNRGASLVLVSILCLIVLSITVTLTVVSAMLLSNAHHRAAQDQAYELAVSLSARVEELILNETKSGGVKYKSCIDLDHFIDDKGGVIINESDFAGIPDSTAKAVVTKDVSGITPYYVVTVTATAGKETHIITSEYSGSATQGYSRK